MDEKIIDFISSNSVLGASAAAALAMLYKIWRILKSDRKEDNLDTAERVFRDELKQDIKQLRDEIKVVKEHNDQCIKENAILQGRIRWLETSFSYCQKNHPPDCPLLIHLGSEQFSNLS